MSTLYFNIYNLSIPLNNPYHLSFCTLINYDTFLVKCIYENRIYWGECTALSKYSWESPFSIWKTIQKWLSVSKNSLSKLLHHVNMDREKNPFAATPFLTVMEKLLHNSDQISISVPIVGTVLTNNQASIVNSTDYLISRGYKTIKLKLTGDLSRDVERVELVQNIIKNHAILRIDANEAYTLSNAISFLHKIDPNGIELFEQPFKSADWNDTEILAKMSPVPIMLDESIWRRADIERTADIENVEFIKLKLMKHSSPGKTMDLIKRAKEFNLNVVLGNGVQSDVGCYDEAQIHARAKLETGGEMNGFLKQEHQLSQTCMIVKNGKLSVKGDLVVNCDLINAYCVSEISASFRYDI